MFTFSLYASPLVSFSWASAVLNYVAWNHFINSAHVFSFHPFFLFVSCSPEKKIYISKGEQHKNYFVVRMRGNKKNRDKPQFSMHKKIKQKQEKINVKKMRIFVMESLFFSMADFIHEILMSCLAHLSIVSFFAHILSLTLIPCNAMDFVIPFY